MKQIFLLFVIFILQACSSLPQKAETLALSASGDAAQMRAVHGDLVEAMINQGNYHAALAHIEELRRGDDTKDRLLLLYAEVLYKLGRVQEAHTEYVHLLGTDLDAEAMHGIGLIHAMHDPKLSLDYLHKASKGRPTDAGMRNDYGFALLRHGQYPEARVQLTTAHELIPTDTRYRNNAVLVMLIQRDIAGAKKLAASTRMSAESYHGISMQAQGWAVIGGSSDPSVNQSNSVAEPAQSKAVLSANNHMQRSEK